MISNFGVGVSVVGSGGDGGGGAGEQSLEAAIWMSHNVFF